LGAIFLSQATLGAIFAKIFRNFAQIFRDFARIFNKSKLLGCACTPTSYTTENADVKLSMTIEHIL